MESLVRNIDVVPTIFDLTGTASRSMEMDGTSFLGLLEGGTSSGPDQNRAFLYEYYWEHAFPHTPTTFALRGDRFKYIYYHGIWGLNELYNLQNDPNEQHNLINIPAYQSQVDSNPPLRPARGRERHEGPLPPWGLAGRRPPARCRKQSRVEMENGS